jgi:hypothetical protein
MGNPPAAVGTTLTARWLGSLESSPSLVPPAGPYVGHFANPVGWATDSNGTVCYLLGHTFDPTVDVPDCTEGFQLLSYHLVLAKTDDEPWTAYPGMVLTDGWRLDLIPPGTTCLSPPSGAYGPRYSLGWYCGTPPISWTPEAAGFYELVWSDLPDCGCVSSDYSHVMNVIPSSIPSGLWWQRVFPAIDEAPGHCPDHWASPNMGYLWWSALAAPGNVIMWAEVTCCEPAVGTTSQKWGSLKATWR